jgi:hypothetical protein
MFDRLDALKRNAVGGDHHIDIIEAEAPGVIELVCSCGARTWTPWGEAHAEEIASIHLWANDVKAVRIFR